MGIVEIYAYQWLKKKKKTNKETKMVVVEFAREIERLMKEGMSEKN